MNEPIEKERYEDNDKRLKELGDGVKDLTEDKPSQQGKNKDFIDNQWKPGESGNPGGRPKDPGITAIQIEMLDKKCPYDSKGRTWREYLAEKGLLLAVNKEGALEHLKERLEGKVPDKHEIETGDISIVYKQVNKDDKPLDK